MPETYQNYHLFQLPLGRDPESSIAFNEFSSDFGDGYEASSLFGSKSGLKRWNVSFPVLTDYTAAGTVTLRGKSYTPAQYLWNLYCYQKVTNEPFVIQSPQNNQYYLAKFANEFLSQTRMTARLTTAGVELKQIRKAGVSVFDISIVPEIYGWYRSPFFNASFGDGDALNDVAWNDESGTGNNISTSAVGVQFQTNEQNGLPVVRLNGTTGFLLRATPATIYEAFFALKYNAATFPNYKGILTGSGASGGDALVGDNGTTKLYNYAVGSSFEFHKNGIAYAENNAQMPMNTFGIIHARFQSGAALDAIQIGKQKNIAGTFAAMDLGEIVLCNSLVAEETKWEIIENLATNWAVS